MATAWIVPAGTDRAPDAAPGDYLLRPAGGAAGQFEVGEIGDGCTWIGTLAASLLPALPQVQEPTAAPEQERVLTAVRGVVSAETHRGG